MQDERAERRKARRFAWTLAGLLVVAAGILRWRGHPSLSFWMAVAALFPPACALAAPPVWFALFRGWMAFGEALNWVVTRLVLIVFFYGVLTPVGFMMRLFGRRPLDLRWPDEAPTFWKERKGAPEPKLERYEKGF